MSRYIIKLHDDINNLDYYLEWSTIVDAPVTHGMTLEEFKYYYQQTHGLAELSKRLDIVEQKGTSGFLVESLDELISFNRAGKNESTITKNQIIETYCRKQLV